MNMHIRSVSSAVLSQSLSSLTNFIFSVHLLRTLATEEFGLFSICFAAAVFLAGFAQGFFTLQYVVLSPSEGSKEFAAEVYALLAVASLTFLIICVLLALAIGRTSHQELIFIGIGVSGIGLALKEFHVRHAFNIGSGGKAILLNSVMGATLLTLSLACWLAGFSLESHSSLMIYAISLGFTALIGHFASGLKLFGHRVLNLKNVMAKVSAGGRWTIANNIVFALRGDAHTLVVAVILGPGTVALVRAARLVMSPPILLLPAISSIALPYFSAMVERGENEPLARAQRHLGLILVSIAVIYCLAVIMIWPVIATTVIGEDYGAIITLVPAWGFYVCTLVYRCINEWRAQAQRAFSLVMRGSMVSAAVALISAWFLTHLTGAIGAILAMGFAEMVMGMYILRKRSTVF